MNILPRPSGATVVPCPSCGHSPDDHTVDDSGITGCEVLAEDSSGTCPCAWTPNDIAYWIEDSA